MEEIQFISVTGGLHPKALSDIGRVVEDTRLQILLHLWNTWDAHMHFSVPHLHASLTCYTGMQWTLFIFTAYSEEEEGTEEEASLEKGRNRRTF